MPAAGRIESEEQERQRRLPAAVAANQEGHLAGPERHIDGPELKRAFVALPGIPVRDADQVEPGPPANVQVEAGTFRVPVRFVTVGVRRAGEDKPSVSILCNATFARPTPGSNSTICENGPIMYSNTNVVPTTVSAESECHDGHANRTVPMAT